MLMDWITGKKIRLSVSISPESLEALNVIAQQDDLTLSEVIEQLSQVPASSESSQSAAPADLAPDHPPSSSPKPSTTDNEPTTERAPSESAIADTPSDLDTPATAVHTPDLAEATAASPATSSSQAAEATSEPEPFFPEPDPEPVAPTSASSSSPKSVPPAADGSEIADLKQKISNLQAQLQDLQLRLAQRRDQQAAQQSKYLALSKKASQQQQQIADLETQVAQLRQTASIGEAQLNRWRSQYFR